MAQKIFSWIRKKGKFVKDGNRRMKKINMKIENRQGRNEIRMEGNIIQTTEKGLKKRVNSKIKEKGLQLWKKGIEKKKSLKWYSKKDIPRKENFYTGGWESTLLYKARSNTLETNSKIYKWKNINKTCEKCMKRGTEVEETLEHIIIECNHYKEEREIFENTIIGKIGENKWKEIKEENQEMENILGFVPENITDMKDTKSYLRKIWEKRKKRKL